MLFIKKIDHRTALRFLNTQIRRLYFQAAGGLSPIIRLLYIPWMSQPVNRCLWVCMALYGVLYGSFEGGLNTNLLYRQISIKKPAKAGFLIHSTAPNSEL